MMRLIFFVSLFAVMLASCNPKDGFYEGAYPDPKLVMHAMLAPDSLVKLDISRSRSLNDTSWFYVKNAKGRLLINGDYVADFTYADRRTLVANAKPQKGDRVRIEVKAPGFKPIWGETHLFSDTVAIRVDTVRNGTRMEYALRIPASAERRYYRLLLESHCDLYRDGVFVEHYRSHPLFDYQKEPVLTDGYEESSNGNNPNHYRIFSNKLFQGNSYTLRFNDDIRFSYTHTYIKEETGEKITETLVYSACIRLLELTPELYRYYHSLTVYNIDSGWEPISIFSNVTGGRGIVGAYSEAAVRFDNPWLDYPKEALILN